jgi:hypothetical protein
MVADLSQLLEQIEAALAVEADVTGIEHTLTDGYARALELEGERLRLERKIREEARLIGGSDTAARAAELAALSQRLAGADGELRTLRARLADLREHADAVRAA